MQKKNRKNNSFGNMQKVYSKHPYVRNNLYLWLTDLYPKR